MSSAARSRPARARLPERSPPAPVPVPPGGGPGIGGHCRNHVIISHPRRHLPEPPMPRMNDARNPVQSMQALFDATQSAVLPQDLRCRVIPVADAPESSATGPARAALERNPFGIDRRSGPMVQAGNHDWRTKDEHRLMAKVGLSAISRRRGRMTRPARPWLVLCMVALIGAFALPSVGRTPAFSPVPVYGTANAYAAVSHGHDHGHAVSECCDHSATAADPDCGFCGPACDICAPLPAEGFARLASGGPAAESAFPASSPGGYWFLLRPPRFSVTA